MTPPAHDVWVFGYGSLMWRPDFSFEEAQHARVTGFRRCFCIYSVHHRGSPQRPGLVLGLDRGGVCEGIVYRVAAANAARTVQYLRAREQVNGVYREAHLPAELIKGRERRTVTALTYIVERAHPSYAGQLPLATQAGLIRGAEGRSGRNLDYLISTLRHLDELGIRERELERLISLTGPHVAHGPSVEHRSPYVASLLRALRSRPLSLPLHNLKPEQRRRFLYRLHLQPPPPAGR
jgi:glutathione-specific gamma-glutamylcyclotransferase